LFAAVQAEARLADLPVLVSDLSGVLSTLEATEVARNEPVEVNEERVAASAAGG
jgi:hypothetical protein